MCIDAKWRFDTWLCMLFLLAAIGSATPVGAANFEVEGSLIATYSQGGTNSAQKTTYVVSVDGARWQIKTIFGEDYYMLHGCDGTNIYSVLHMPGGPDGQAAPATITPGVCPVDAEYYTTLPWLAFASDRYLEQNTDSLPAFWVNPRSDAMAWMFESRVERLPSTPRLPRTVAYVTTRARLTTAPTNSQLRMERIPAKRLAFRTILPASLPAGFQGGEFSITSTTNFDGLEIPNGFQAVTYALPSGEKQVKTNMLLIGTVTRIGPSTLNSYLPEISQNLSVTDYRFRNSAPRVDCITYFITNSAWTSDRDPRLASAFNLKKDQSPTFRSGTISHIFYYAIFAFFLFLPAIIPLLTWTKRKSETTT